MPKPHLRMINYLGSKKPVRSPPPVNGVRTCFGFRYDPCLGAHLLRPLPEPLMWKGKQPTQAGGAVSRNDSWTSHQSCNSAEKTGEGKQVFRKHCYNICHIERGQRRHTVGILGVLTLNGVHNNFIMKALLGSLKFLKKNQGLWWRLRSWAFPWKVLVCLGVKKNTKVW